MMKKRTIIIGLPILLVLFIGTLALKPISNITLEDTERIQGRLESIDTNEKTRDISLKIEGHKTNFYINRGLDKGEILSSLEAEKEGIVEICYAKNWTPLDPFGKNKHIVRIVGENDLVYDEISK
jgi:hypothetical protein